MNINSTKNQLRKELRAKRKALDQVEVAVRSQELVRLLIEKIDWARASNIHCFLPLFDDNEPDLRAFIEYALDKNSNVYTSNPNPQTGRRITGLQDDDKQNKLFQFRLEEKIKFDYIVIPMLGFDPVTKHRLGFGGGFYDQLLASQPDSKKIGVCFNEFTVDALPVESHDVPLDKIVSI